MTKTLACRAESQCTLRCAESAAGDHPFGSKPFVRDPSSELDSVPQGVAASRPIVRKHVPVDVERDPDALVTEALRHEFGFTPSCEQRGVRVARVMQPLCESHAGRA